MAIDVGNEGNNTQAEVHHQDKPHDSGTDLPLCPAYHRSPHFIIKENYVAIGTQFGISVAPKEQLGASDNSKDFDMNHISEQVAEDTEPTVVGEDPSAILALQEQHFNLSDHNDNTIEPGINLRLTYKRHCLISTALPSKNFLSY